MKRVKKMPSQQLAHNLIGICKYLHLTVSVAESLTGGMIGGYIAAIPGASEIFKGGSIVYTNEMKEKMLGVNPETLEKYTAVSKETAIEMAEGVRELTGSDLSIAVTGIAGPGGGTSEIPKGTVWIAIASKEFTKTFVYKFTGNRQQIRGATANTALKRLLEVTACYS